MTNSSMVAQADRTRGVRRAAFDLIVSKLRHPPTRPGAVDRSPLIDRLAGEESPPIVSVVAPAGYGKTTLLSQWAGRGGPAFAWVSVDERDNDPKVLLTYLAAALERVAPVDARVFAALASRGSSVPGSVVPRLASAFSAMTVPVVLVLDDVHLLSNRQCRAALSVLADHVPDGSRLVLAGRDEPPLRRGRLRAESRILEIGPGDLALSRAEAESLLGAAGLRLGGDDVAVLHRRTEGWPVGLYLAALYLREGGSVGGAAVSFGGDDRLVSEYVESEFLERISRRQRVFLTRTAVLERMSASLCEEVLQAPGSAAALAELAGSNLLLVPLDRRGQWYRYHHLFRDMLLAELQRAEPGLVPVLRRRAARWCLRNGLPEEALEYSMAAEDTETAAGLVRDLYVLLSRQGRDRTLHRWLGWLDDRGAIEASPMLTVWAALFAAVETGQPAEAERWADEVDRWQYRDGARPEDPAAEAWAAVLRALLCRHGVERMRADADDASHRLAVQGIVSSSTAFLGGIARILSGDLDTADALLEDAVDVAERTGAHEMRAGALGERSLVAMKRGQWRQAEAFAGQASTVLREAGIEESYVVPLVCAVRAQVALRQGDAPAARQHLFSAQRSRPLLTYAIPHVSVQALAELTRVHLALADPAGARTLMRQVDELLARRPDLGNLADEVAEPRTLLTAERRVIQGRASSLTVAELRVLPLLATHLSFREIAAELSVSPHTVKSQAMSIYRKLGASSRNQAVIQSRELGLLAE
jgi:LuxR family maltose regulon positive regulatory protein